MPSSLAIPVLQFFGWWRSELAGLLPRSIASGAHGRAGATVLAIGRDRLELIEERGRSSQVLAAADITAEGGLEAAMSILDGRSVNGPVGIRVAREACFSRSLSIPTLAASDAAALAVLDLERATPFRAADVLTAVIADAASPPVKGKTAIRQLVLKRETVRPVLAGLASRGISPAFIDCWTDDRSTGLPVDFLTSDRAGARSGAARPGFVNRALATVTVLALASAAAMVVIKYDNALVVLDLDVAAARRDAQTVGQRLASTESAIAEANRLRALGSARPRALEIIEEVTRLLPDDAFLVEFNLEGGQLDVTGYAKSAAPLLETFERSTMFVDARFTAPFRFEPREERERFAMRVRLRPADGKAIAGPAVPKE